MRRQPNIFLASGFSEADKANMKAQQKKIETQKGFLMDYTYAQASADAGVGVPEWRNISWDVWMRLCRDGTPEANWKRNEKKKFRNSEKEKDNNKQTGDPKCKLGENWNQTDKSR